MYGSKLTWNALIQVLYENWCPKSVIFSCKQECTVFIFLNHSILSIPFQKAWDQTCLGIRCFWILEYLHIHNEISWGWDPSLHMKFTCVSYTFYTHSPKVIWYNIFINCVFWLWLVTDMEFSTCGTMLKLKKFQIWEHFRFHIFRVGMLNLYVSISICFSGMHHMVQQNKR